MVDLGQATANPILATVEHYSSFHSYNQNRCVQPKLYKKIKKNTTKNTTFGVLHSTLKRFILLFG